MEKNTVILDLEDYNELRDFKNEIFNSDAVIISTFGIKCYFKKPELRKEFEEMIEGYVKAEKLNYQKFNEMSDKLDNFKKMNIFQFIKWKIK